MDANEQVNGVKHQVTKVRLPHVLRRRWKYAGIGPQLRSLW